jgi:hypothetical protein
MNGTEVEWANLPMQQWLTIIQCQKILIQLPHLQSTLPFHQPLPRSPHHLPSNLSVTQRAINSTKHEGKHDGRVGKMPKAAGCKSSSVIRSWANYFTFKASYHSPCLLNSFRDVAMVWHKWCRSSMKSKVCPSCEIPKDQTVFNDHHSTNRLWFCSQNNA